MQNHYNIFAFREVLVGDLGIMGKVWKLLNRTGEHGNFLQIQLELLSLRKKSALYLKMRKLTSNILKCQNSLEPHCVKTITHQNCLYYKVDQISFTL